PRRSSDLALSGVVRKSQGSRCYFTGSSPRHSFDGNHRFARDSLLDDLSESRPSTKTLKDTRFQIGVLAPTIISFVRDVGIALGGWRRLGGFFYEYVLVFELPLSSATDSMATRSEEHTSELQSR